MKLKSTQLKLTPGTIISLIVLGLAVLCALFPQLFTSQDPNQGGDTTALLQPSFQHWFGTDAVGRDLYTRVVYGAHYLHEGHIHYLIDGAQQHLR